MKNWFTLIDAEGCRQTLLAESIGLDKGKDYSEQEIRDQLKIDGWDTSWIKTIE